ncbi:hypothetical protein [Nonomuraea polychroma]|uniref:hypothetical protein n=1 Tax=Nonomuraea polychroma TaxID=46176 RepID=UPI000FDD940D|nr:hypothetical protein [Nonomuraea polychroma]
MITLAFSVNVGAASAATWIDNDDPPAPSAQQADQDGPSGLTKSGTEPGRSGPWHPDKYQTSPEVESYKPDPIKKAVEYGAQEAIESKIGKIPGVPNVFNPAVQLGEELVGGTIIPKDCVKYGTICPGDDPVQAVESPHFYGEGQR